VLEDAVPQAAASQPTEQVTRKAIDQQQDRSHLVTDSQPGSSSSSSRHDPDGLVSKLEEIREREVELLHELQAGEARERQLLGRLQSCSEQEAVLQQQLADVSSSTNTSTSSGAGSGGGEAVDAGAVALQLANKRVQRVEVMEQLRQARESSSLKDLKLRNLLAHKESVERKLGSGELSSRVAELSALRESHGDGDGGTDPASASASASAANGDGAGGGGVGGQVPPGAARTSNAIEPLLDVEAPSSSGRSALSAARSGEKQAAAGQIRELKFALAQLHDELASARRALDEVASLQSDNLLLREERDTLMQGHAQALEEVAALQRALQVQRQETSQVTRRAESLELEISRVSADRDILAGNLASAVSQAVAMGQQRDAAVARMLVAQHMQQEAEKEAKALGEKVVTLETQLQAATGTQAALQQQLEEQRAHSAALMQKMEELRAQSAAREDQLVSEADEQARKLAVTERVLWSRVQVATAAAKGQAPEGVQVAFTNTNRYWVPSPLLYDFTKALASREVALTAAAGFLGMTVRHLGEQDFSVSTRWESLPSWEAWSCSPSALRQHNLPPGIMQYVPRKGEGFPESYIPFRDMNDAVNAKY